LPTRTNDRPATSTAHSPNPCSLAACIPRAINIARSPDISSACWLNPLGNAIPTSLKNVPQGFRSVVTVSMFGSGFLVAMLSGASSGSESLVGGNGVAIGLVFPTNRSRRAFLTLRSQLLKPQSERSSQ
jgi:hypothetical protein